MLSGREFGQDRIEKIRARSAPAKQPTLRQFKSMREYLQVARGPPMGIARKGYAVHRKPLPWN
jgi:hypothetical protein